MRATILAFDGVLADTLPLRLHALREACAAEGVAIADQYLDDVLPGCTFAEAVALLTINDSDPFIAPIKGSESLIADPTLVELIALRAQRGYGALVAHGVPLFPGAVRRLRADAARGARLVVRADSERRHVEPLLELAGLAHLVSLGRCSDDLPRSTDPSLRRSWIAIDARLTRLGVAAARRTAWEATAMTASAAAPFVADVLVGAHALADD